MATEKIWQLHGERFPQQQHPRGCRGAKTDQVMAVQTKRGEGRQGGKRAGRRGDLGSRGPNNREGFSILALVRLLILMVLVNMDKHAGLSNRRRRRTRVMSIWQFVKCVGLPVLPFVYYREWEQHLGRHSGIPKWPCSVGNWSCISTSRQDTGSPTPLGPTLVSAPMRRSAVTAKRYHITQKAGLPGLLQNHPHFSILPPYLGLLLYTRSCFLLLLR